MPWNQRVIGFGVMWRKKPSCFMKSWVAAEAIRPGTGTDTVIPGYSIHPSKCSLTGEVKDPSCAHLRPTDHGCSPNPCFSVRPEVLAPCSVLAAASTCRASSKHPYTRPPQHFYSSASLCPFLAFLFTILVSPFLLPISRQVNFFFPTAPSSASPVSK